MNAKMTAGLALLAAAIMMVGTTAAQAPDRTANKTEEADVTVSVSDTIAVDIQPANLDYSNAVVGNRNTTSDRDFGAIEISNTGSVYINRVWLNASVPNSNPFGTGSAANYDAGNFLEVRPTSDVESGPKSNWQFVNRKEFMWTSEAGNIPSFIQVPSTWSSDSSYAVAALRRGNETIYAAVDSQSGTCDGSNSMPVRVGNVSSTDSRLGTVDFTSSTEYGWVEYTLTQASGNSYGITTDPNTGFGLSGVGLNYTYTQDGNPIAYDLMTKCDAATEPANMLRTKYNINAEGADSLSTSGVAAKYILASTTDAGVMLAPGEMATIETAINVPEGVAAGSVSPGKLRVLITSDPDESTS